MPGQARDRHVCPGQVLVSCKPHCREGVTSARDHDLWKVALFMTCLLITPEAPACRELGWITCFSKSCQPVKGAVCGRLGQRLFNLFYGHKVKLFLYQFLQRNKVGRGRLRRQQRGQGCGQRWFRKEKPYLQLLLTDLG